jgi:signal transduction histidine kinase
VLDADGQAIMTNAAAEPLASELARRSSQLTSHFACGGVVEDAGCAACLAQTDATSRMCVLDVGERVFEVHATSMPAAPDGRRGRVLVARDITSRVAQDEREIHQERLSVLGEVAAVMAHELNNPLTSIRMFAQMLADQLPEGSPFHEHADVILRNTDTCRSSIRDLLGYATATAPIAADIDVHAVLHDVARFVRPLGERARATLKLELEAQHDLVSGDEIQLRQVFVNLVVNAVQAADHDGTQLTIRSRNVENWLEIDIEDTGSGVAPEVLPRLFDPFFSTKARGEGTGLGLSTARRIVELHGGRLELASSKPGLTTFRLRLPTRSEGQSTPTVAASLEGVS